MFQRIRPRSVADEIVDQVLSLVFTGQLAPGTRLPSERALSQAFGAGRQAVREGLSQLPAMGLVKVRKPYGAFVQLATPDTLRTPLLRVLADEIRGVEHFLDVRKRLEGMTAAEAAERATEDDLTHLDGSLAKLEAASDRNAPRRWTRATSRFTWPSSPPPTIR